MVEPSYGRGWSALGVGALSIAFLFVLLGSLSMGSPAFAASVATSNNWTLGAGVVTVGTVQNVTGTPYWETYCASSQSACTVPVGVVYIPTSNTMVLTEMHTTAGGLAGGTNAIMEFSPDTLQSSPLLRLSCSPGVPFYPGSGVDVLVPCFNATAYQPGTLLVLDEQTQSIVANLSMPFNVVSMAYDSSNGMIYMGANENVLAMFNPANDTIVKVANVTGASFLESLPYNDYKMVFDAATDQLLLPTSTGELLGVNPATGVASTVLTLASYPVTLAIDPATGDLFASTSDPTTLEIFDAASYDLEANISIPNCVLVCAEPNDVNQILIDPAHGDAYLDASVSLFTLNLSTLSIVSAFEDYGNGFQATAAYSPVSDRIFGTYGPLEVGPGFLIQLNHRTYPVVTTLLWLPTGPGTLTLATVVGSVLSLLYLRFARRPAAQGTIESHTSPNARTFFRRHP